MSTMLERFDLSAALPGGITVLEASAGTGKTYSIAHLLVRLVAEEAVPVEQVNPHQNASADNGQAYRIIRQSQLRAGLLDLPAPRGVGI